MFRCINDCDVAAIIKMIELVNREQRIILCKLRKQLHRENVKDKLMKKKSEQNTNHHSIDVCNNF